MLALLGCIFTAVFLVTALDYGIARFAEWKRSVGQARVYPAVQFAYALKGLTMAQTDLVQRQMETIIFGIPGDPGPEWYIRGNTMDIPLLFVMDFFEWSQQTAPYLWPVRDGHLIGGGDGWKNGVQYAQDLTNLLVKNGYAAPAAGNNAALLVEPLPKVAKNFGVEM